MQNYLKLLRFLKGHEKIFTIAVITMLVAGFFEVFSLSMLAPMVDVIFTKKQIVLPNKLPDFLQTWVDQANATDPVKLLPTLLLIFAGLLLLKNFLIFVYQYLMGDVSQRLMRDIRLKLYERIQSLSLDYFSKKRTGELVSRITHDTNLIENAVSYGLTDLFRQTFIIIFWIGTALTIDIRAALIVFGIFP